MLFFTVFPKTGITNTIQCNTGNPLKYKDTKTQNAFDRNIQCSLYAI